MARRGELTEEVWSVIAPLLPRSEGRRGEQWRDHQRVINGILWKLRTGAPWRQIDPHLLESANDSRSRYTVVEWFVMVPLEAGQLRKKRARHRMARFRGKTYWAYSIGCAIVWAVVLAIFLTLWASETRPLLLGMFGWWICWVLTTISRYAFPPAKRWMANPPQTVNSFRSYWVYSGCLVIAWAVVLTLAWTTLGGHVAQALVVVFDGFCLGWISTTIARYGYPPPKRWTLNARHAPTA